MATLPYNKPQCDVCGAKGIAELYPEDVDGAIVYACETCFQLIDAEIVKRRISDEPEIEVPVAIRDDLDILDQAQDAIR